MSTQIEMAKREETLIAQRGQNERKRASEQTESKRIEAEGAAANVRVNAAAQAESIRLLEEARVVAERERMEIHRSLPPAMLMGLAARELAVESLFSGSSDAASDRVLVRASGARFIYASCRVNVDLDRRLSSVAGGPTRTFGCARIWEIRPPAGGWR